MENEANWDEFNDWLKDRELNTQAARERFYEQWLAMKASRPVDPYLAKYRETMEQTAARFTKVIKGTRGKLRTGNTPFLIDKVIVRNKQFWVIGTYIESKSYFERSITDVVAYKDNGRYLEPHYLSDVLEDFMSSPRNPFAKPEKEPEEMTNVLFKLKEDDKEVYVRKIGQDGNMVVIKEENTGNLRAVDPALLEEVLPYTVAIKFLGGNGTTYHYFADEGEFAKDDLLVDNPSGNYAMVMGTNTKSKSANKRFKGWKVNATPLKE